MISSGNENISEIKNILVNDHGCHTVILYGSRASGEETPASDYDMAGFKDTDKVLRDARLWNGAYLDLFVYPEAKLVNPDESMLHMRGGKILCEKDSLGTKFFAQLDDLYRKGPKKLPDDEIQALNTWARKSLDRVRGGGLEGDFRRVQMIPILLEHFFTTRGLWYRGPKEGLRWLKEHQPDVHSAFASSLAVGAGLPAIEALVRAIQEAEKGAGGSRGSDVVE